MQSQYGDSSLPPPPPQRLASRSPSGSQVLEWFFKTWPIGFPMTLIVVGLATWEIYWVLGLASALTLAIGSIAFAAGIITLPFGVRTALRRRKPVVLSCPHCGAVSGSGTAPFSIKRWSDTPYAYVVCSSCGRDFTIDKYINAR